MPPKSRLKSLKARFKRILSDREDRKNHEFKDSASSSSSSDKQKLSPPSRFKKKKSGSSSSSANSKTKKFPSLVRAVVSSSSSSSDNMNRSPSKAKNKAKKKSSSSSEFSSDSHSGIPVKSIKKLQLIGLESRLKLPLHETSQVSPSSKLFASDPRLLYERDRDQRGSRRGLWSTTLSPTSTETSSPALPRYSFSLNDSSLPSSPGRAERTNEEPSASQSAYEPTAALLGKSEGNSKVQSKVSSPNVKRVQSAFLDDERGVWRCRVCGWIYPNPNPSARHRRDHKKHCGEMLNVQQWLKVTDSGPMPGVTQFDTGVGKAPSSSKQDRGQTVKDPLLDFNRAAASETMTDQEAERVTSVEDGKKELLDPQNVTKVNTTDSRVDTAELAASRETVSELDAESREGDSHTPRIPDNAVVVNEFADNDAEGQVSQTDVGDVNSANEDTDVVGLNEVEEKTNVEETEEQQELQNAEAMEEAKDEESVARLETSEVLKREESDGETQVDDALDGPGMENSRQLDLEHLGDEAKDDIQLAEEMVVPKNYAGQDEESATEIEDSVGDPTAENSVVVEDVHREFSLSDDETDMKISEEADFGTAALGAGQDDVDGEAENEKSGIKAKLPAFRNDGELISLDSRDGSDSDGNGNHTESNGLKEENEIDTVNQAHYVEPHTVVGADDERSFDVDSSVKEVSAPKSLVVGTRSTSSSSSSTSPSAGDGSDDDINTPRNTYEDVRTPLTAPQEAYFIERRGSTDAKDVNLTPPVEETTAKPWRSRNAMQDELLESINDEAVSSESWTSHQDVLPETVEGNLKVITPTISTTALQSPPDTTASSSSTSDEVVTVGSSVKKLDFKSRQKYWAEITRSDILEGSQKLPSSITSISFFSEDHRTPPLVDDMQSPSTSVTTFFSEGDTTPYLVDDVQDPSSTVTIAYQHSRQDNNEKEVVVTKSELVLTEASSSNFHAEASSSNFHSEASTSKFSPLSPAGSSNAYPVDGYDLERVIHEQKTHDIMCPVCGSCITKRVILRKRKRYLPPEEPKRPRFVPAPPTPEPRTLEDEGWGCLACFSIFFPRVGPGKEEESKEGSSCLQIVFPSFPWGPKERTNPELVTPLLPPHENTAEPAPPPTSSNKAQEEDGCFSYLRVFKRPSVSESPQPELVTPLLRPDNNSPDPGIHEPGPPSSPTPLPPSSRKEQEEEGCLSYFKISKRPPAPESSRPAEPGIYEPEPPTPTPLPAISSSAREEDGCLSYLKIPRIPFAPKSPRPGQIPGTPSNLESGTSAPDGSGEEMRPEADVKDEGETTPRELPASSQPDASDSKLALPYVPPVVPPVPSSPPVSPRENNRGECFKVFLPVFPWGPAELKVGNEMPRVIPPEVSLDDRKCLPLFGFPRTPRQQTPEENRVTPHEVLEDELPLSAVEPVPPPEIQDSPPPPEVSSDDRKCLPVFWLARTPSQQTPEIRVTPHLALDDELLLSSVEPVPTPEIRDSPPPPEVSSDDRKCLPLPWLARTPSQQTPAIRVTPHVAPEDELPLSGVEHGRVLTPETLGSPPPRECLPFIRSQLYVKPAGPPATKPTPNVEQREAWRNWRPLDIRRDTLQLSIQQFFEENVAHTILPAAIHTSTSDLNPELVSPVSSPSQLEPEPVVLVPSPSQSKTEPVLPVPSSAPPPESLDKPREERATNCISLLLPTFPWGPPVQVPEGDSVEREPAADCLDLVLPSFSLGSEVPEPLRDSAGPGSTVLERPPTDEQPRPITTPKPREDETDSKEPGQKEKYTLPEKPPSEVDSGPASESRYTTKTIIAHVLEKEVIVRRDSIEVHKSATHFESLYGKAGEIISSEVIHDKPSTSTPSTSSVTDAGSSVGDGELAQQVADKVNALSRESPRVQETHNVSKQNDHGLSCSCLPFELPSLSWSWEAHPGGKETRTSDLPSRPAVVPHLPGLSGPVPPRRKDPYKEYDDLREPLLPQNPSTDNAATNTRDPTESQYLTINIHEESLTVRTAVTSGGDTATPGEGPEILRSLVYGGLDTTLISLGVVSSATGGDAKTLTVITIGLANVAFGFLAFLGTITALYRSDRLQFKQLIGPSYGFNGLLACFAYLVFGLLPPLTFAFSFRHETNRDWKMGSTCLVVLVSLILLGWAKARVTSQNPYKVIMTLVTTGFVAAIASYKVGDYTSWFLKDIGFDSV